MYKSSDREFWTINPGNTDHDSLALTMSLESGTGVDSLYTLTEFQMTVGIGGFSGSSKKGFRQRRNT